MPRWKVKLVYTTNVQVQAGKSVAWADSAYGMMDCQQACPGGTLSVWGAGPGLRQQCHHSLMPMRLVTTGDHGADEMVDSQAQAACVLYSVRPMYCFLLAMEMVC